MYVTAGWSLWERNIKAADDIREITDLQLLSETEHLSGQHILLSAQFLPLAPLSLHLVLRLGLLGVKPAHITHNFNIRKKEIRINLQKPKMNCFADLRCQLALPLLLAKEKAQYEPLK